MNHRKMFVSVGLFLAVPVLLAASTPSFASEFRNSGSNPIVYFHVGDTDPVEEGWQILENGGKSGSIIDENFNIPIWNISGSRLRNYFHMDTPEQGESWTLITRFRVMANINTPLSFDVVAGVDYGYDAINGTTSNNRYIFAAGSDRDRNTLLKFQPVNFAQDATLEVVVPAIPIGRFSQTDYVTVALAHDGTDMDVFVNGVKRFSDLPGIPAPERNQVLFGDGATDGGYAESNWAEVSYSTGPQDCRDGIDNDGDGFTDHSGGDTDCSDPNDPTEGESCAPGQHRRSIAQSSKWYLLTLPCLLPSDATFADLLGAQMLQDDEWAAYTYDAATPGYERITADSPAPSPGTGFWFISTEPVELVIPPGSYQALRVSAAACNGEPCYRQSMEPQASWNLLGNPTTENIKYNEMLVSNASTSCIDNSEACRVAQPTDTGIASAMYVYNSFAGEYRLVDENVQQVVKPWDGYWVIFAYDDDLSEPWQMYSVPYPSQIVFVTDNSFTGDLGGIEGADNICQQAAVNAGLPGEYKAWISDSSSSPGASFLRHDTPYVRVDGEIVADDWNDLTSALILNPRGFIQNPINTTPTLNIAADSNVWTATFYSGEFMDEDSLMSSCNNWTTTTGRGIVGTTRNTSTPGAWTVESSEFCNTEARLYCFNQ